MRLALNRLNEQEREVLVMRHLEQLSISEIAIAMSLTEGAVRMRRLRAIQHLRELLDEEQEKQP